MKKFFLEISLRPWRLYKGRSTERRASGSSALSRGFAARSLLSSAQLLQASQGFSIAFSLFFFREMNRAQILTILTVLQKTVKIVKILSVSI